MGDVDPQLLDKLSSHQPARRRRAKPSQQTRRPRKPTTTRKTSRATDQSEDSYSHGSHHGSHHRGSHQGRDHHGSRYRDRRTRARRSHQGLPDEFDRFEAELDEEEKEEKEDTGPTYYPPPYHPSDDKMSLMVVIKSCRGLLPGDKMSKSSNPRVEVMMGDQILHTTNTVEDTLNPVFHETDRNAFVFEVGGSEIYDHGGLFFFIYHGNVKLGYASASARQVDKTGEKIELTIKPPGGRLSEKAGFMTIAIRPAIIYVSEPPDLDTDALQIKLNIVSYNCLAVPDGTTVNPYAMIRLAGETLHETKPKPSSLVPISGGLIGNAPFFKQDDESNKYVLKTTCGELYSAGGIWFEVYDDSTAIGRAFVRSKALVLSTNDSMCFNLELPPRREGANGGYIRVQAVLTDDKPETEFKSFIEIKGCNDILAGDETTSDPYVCVKLGARLLHKTKRRNKTLNPEYAPEHGNSFYLDTTIEQLRENKGLTLEVYDFDLVGADDLLGTCTVPWDVLKDLSGDLVYDLVPPEDRKGESAGKISLASTPLDHAKTHGANLRSSQLGTENVAIFVEIDGCNNILIGDVTTSDPYIVASYQGKQIHKTKRRNKTLNPVYTKEHNNSFLLQTTRRELYDNDGILLEIFDYDLIGEDDLLGSTNIPAGALEIGDGNLMRFTWEPPPDQPGAEAGSVAMRIRPGEPGDPGFKDMPSTLADQLGGALQFASTTFASSKQIQQLKDDDDDDDDLLQDVNHTFNAFDDEPPPPPPPPPVTEKKSPRRERSPHRSSDRSPHRRSDRSPNRTKSSPGGGSPKRIVRKSTGPDGRARSPRRRKPDGLRVSSEHSPIRRADSHSPSSRDGSVRPKKEHGVRKKHRSPKRTESNNIQGSSSDQLLRTRSSRSIGEDKDRLSRSRSARNMREEDAGGKSSKSAKSSGDGKVKRVTRKTSGEVRKSHGSSPKLSPKGKPRTKTKVKQSDIFEESF